MVQVTGVASLAAAFLFSIPVAWAGEDRVKAWVAVEEAATAAEQEQALQSFMLGLARGGAPATYSLTAKRAGTGEIGDFEDGMVLAQPREHVLTLVVEGKAYSFQPLSARAVTLLLRE